MLNRLEAELGIRRNDLPAGYFDELHHPQTALDFSDVVVMVHADMPEDLAHLVTWTPGASRRPVRTSSRGIGICHNTARPSGIRWFRNGWPWRRFLCMRAHSVCARSSAIAANRHRPPRWRLD